MRDLQPAELSYVYGAGGGSKCRPTPSNCKPSNGGKGSGSKGSGSSGYGGGGRCRGKGSSS